MATEGGSLPGCITANGGGRSKLSIFVSCSEMIPVLRVSSQQLFGGIFQREDAGQFSMIKVHR